MRINCPMFRHSLSKRTFRYFKEIALFLLNFLHVSGQIIHRECALLGRFCCELSCQSRSGVSILTLYNPGPADFLRRIESWYQGQSR